ncbi:MULTISPECIES: YebC/PmpR family DNA-binding transcriptional regulator [unclassified Fusibacter]|uniref:YebC/PmpR family DNA-binding transcriptional regulator n=1 Tax=unclassified Fusibacter TaxID=2624464 RepID=UPI001011BBFD|nr:MULTISPECIES: YebC/PmpR family DNA-binding transcriptional regulator [unclassified Fusibacter]MCK8061159.1 YebC/PmpR family DNA-binding transcriptional regulator [Fusibacter sp. A2]NPE23304.1 YebC/PmpR family DNA-binding transcriptional regulator [Fusibacter sp. A1]RXV59346.1 YebC/PmpR family DNA-binding transcriptional regulator [Fusibacter sp. A1]
MGRIGTIINRKGKQDAKKAKIFTKLARYITVAAKEGGGDPEYNAALATAIEKAKAANMPNDNIDRAIKKGTGDSDGVVYSELTYEGYGPGGIAVLVECLTDNTNRTSADVRSYFSKGKGNLGVNGSVSFMFDRKGVLVIDKVEGMDEEELEMQVIEAGAEDFVVEEDHFEVYTEVEDFSTVRNALAAEGIEFSMAELRYLPTTMTKLTDEEDIKYMNKMIDLFEDNDDIQNIYHNWDESSN